ncbi:MAG: CopG family ribbon-helix-helix protein [Methanobacteriota archaeon]
MGARKGSKAVPVTVSLPQAMLAELDRLVARTPFPGRSDAVQAAIREFLSDQRPGAAPSGPEDAVISVCFGGADERRVAAVRHEHERIIRSMMHTHLGDDCVEVFVVAGKRAEIDAFYAALRAQRGVHLVRRTVMPSHASYT